MVTRLHEISMLDGHIKHLFTTKHNVQKLRSTYSVYRGSSHVTTVVTFL